MRTWTALIPVLLAAATMACSGPSANNGDGGSRGGPVPDAERRIVNIPNNENATNIMLVAAAEARPGDTLKFECGYYELETGLVLNTTEDIVIEGCGIDETVLSFKNSLTSEGIFANVVSGLVVRHLTVLDSPGDAIKLKGVHHGTLQSVRTIWSSGRKQENEDAITAENYTDGRLNVACTNPPSVDPESPQGMLPGADSSSPDFTPSRLTGRYGIYPVASEDILIEDSEAVGASDAGIYVGQTTRAIIRNSRAAYNVMGFEIENVQGGEYENNLGECNTGGFLIYDLDGLDQYGYGTRMYNNIVRNNNTYNFNSGGFVGNVPAGSGVITLSYDRIDMFDNEIYNNDTGGLLWVSYALFPEGDRPSETQIDFYTEGVNIFNNTFRNNGNNLPQPDFAKIVSSGGSDVNSALPFIVGLKSALGFASADPALLADLASPEKFAAAITRPWTLAGFRGAHVVWDGLLDELDTECEYPIAENTGEPVPEATYAPGKPEYRNNHGNPDCRYNAYKFDDAGVRKEPQWLGCIQDNNHFEADSAKFVNFHGLDGLEVVIAGDPAALNPATLPNLRSSTDMSRFVCGEEFELLPPVVLQPFVPSGDIDAAPTEERIAELCGANTGNAVNFAAAREVDCPDLAQYNLFADEQDPRSAPNSDGTPYSLNTKLFSDYAVKYRVAYLPPGQQAIYRDQDTHNNANTGIFWPVGTVIAKTFAFPDATAGTEDVVETRLLIKRKTSNGKPYWQGLPYIWQTDANGKRKAVLAKAGGTAEVNWDYDGYTGSTSEYLIPHAAQCVTCHGNDDVEVGAAPIGPKARNINRSYKNESPFDNRQNQIGVGNGNQIAHLCRSGKMRGCPSTSASFDNKAQTFVIEGIERVPNAEVPTDIGNIDDASFPYLSETQQGIQARARAYLEVNCQHCHNNEGVASNTGVFFDVFRRVDIQYGICKGPTAAGAGAGDRPHDIHPGNVDLSIVPYRMEATTDTKAKMPPIARSVQDVAAVELINSWISTVVHESEDAYPNSGCASGSGNNGGGSELDPINQIFGSLCAPNDVPGVGGQCLTDVPVIGDVLNTLIGALGDGLGGGLGDGGSALCAPDQVPGIGGQCLEDNLPSP